MITTNGPKKRRKKKFIVINEAFKCENCGKKNPPLQGSCRNHCKYCLYSKHVDKETPGDRESECKSLMKPTDADYDGKKGYLIIHRCEGCKKEIRNKCAEDDNFDAIITLSRTKKL